MNLKEITVTVLTRNSEKHIEEVLTPLSPFGEILILDSGSTDATLNLCKKFSNTRIEKTVFDGFGAVHNRAIALAQCDWIFSVDSDEVVTPELLEEIRNLQPNRKTVYAIPRKNYYNNRWIRGCGWYPDYVKRLFHKQETQFCDAHVHESVITKNLSIQRLNGAFLHYSYDSTADFLHKMQSYSSLWAKQNEGKKSSLFQALLRGSWAFFRSYILKKGFIDGREGVVISFYNANTTFYKYLKLMDKSKIKKDN